MARQETATTIINRTALEVGLDTVTDPVASSDKNFIQLTGLLTVAGMELVELHEWEVLNAIFTFTTAVPSDTGSYSLPTDFAYMIDQTGWDKTNNIALAGPLSPQDWSYLDGRDLVSQSIYASFRIQDNMLELFPQPPPNGLEVRFEYISRNWAKQSDDTPIEEISNGSDVVLYDPLMTQKFLKVKWLEAKGFDSSAARIEFENIFNARTGKDTGAPIINAGRARAGVPYLTPYRNTRDTGYGA